MLTASGIFKNYGKLPVLRGVDIGIAKGEIVSIVGSSGAGKSTLLHILGTLDKPDQGSVSLDGQRLEELNGKKLSAFRNKHIGFVFQFHNLLPEFTALENVIIPGLIGGRNDREVKERGLSLLERLGLHDRMPLRSSIAGEASEITWLTVGPLDGFPSTFQLPTGSVDLLAVVGVTEQEAGYGRKHGGATLIDLLRQETAYPVTDWRRSSLVGAA